MKHIYYAALSLFCFFLSKNGFSQNLTVPCGADYWLEKSLQDPVLFQKHQEYEKGILQVFQQQKTSPEQSGMAKTIPVVVHIIHDGGTENLSDAQAQQAITWLNQSLANQGYFDRGSGADCGIQLCSAQRTPDGQPTNGITRDQSPLTVMQMETQDLLVKNLNRWKPKDYVNIWVVRTICSSNYGCNVYGYSNYPSSHGSNSDGIMIEAAFLTDPEKVSGLAHELGHYLGLYHTFEGNCTNTNCLTQGDRICDTPPDQSTSSLPCTETFSSCSTDTQSGPFSTDQPDMTQNFLDYGILACFHDYTPDQATRMNATLDGIRKSLLESKGCLPPCPAPTVAGFTASATTVEVGETVNFSNTSLNASSYTWTVNGTQFETQTNAAYTFTMPGTYTILLTAQPSNSSLCEPDDFQLTIQVYCSVTASFTVSELTPDQDETITLSNTSQNATQTEWFVDGVSQGSALDSISFNDAGDYQIQLIATNGPCESSAIVEVQVQPICDEENRLFQLAYQESPMYLTLGKEVITLKDHNLVFLFNNEAFGLPSSVSLVKLTPAGKQVWAKRLGNHLIRCSTDGGLTATSDGGFALTFNSDTTYDAMIGKFSSDGELLWVNRFLGDAVFHDLKSTEDGNITACGTITDSNPSQSIFVQFDANGIFKWSRAYSSGSALGAFTIDTMPDGGFVGVDRSNGLYRLSSTGDLVWCTRISGTVLSDVIVLETGELAACGFTNSYTQGAFIKLSSDFSPILLKKYSTINNLGFSAIIEDGEQGFTLSANSLTQAAIIGLGETGNVKWGNSDMGLENSSWENLTKFEGIGYVLVGRTRNTNSTTKGWICKTDQKGLIGDCHSITPSVSVSDILNPSVIEVPNAEVIPQGFETASMTVHDWVVKPDTICAFACAASIEICNNNLDDDGDGLFDCLDADCDCTEDQCSPQQANLWYFGNSAGLDFSTEPPTVLSDGMSSSNYISSTMCDSKGNLLFYTDGYVVYNRFHQAMPNGYNQSGGESIIVPHPGNSALYYLILVSELDGIRIYIVDMSLDDGRGDVAAPLLAAFTNGLAVTKACSFNGYWALTRRPTDGTTLEDFWAFKIDEDGLDPSIVYSNVGQAMDVGRHLKISPDGKRVACSYQTAGKYYLGIYDFDPYNTGTVSNPRVLNINPAPSWLSGAEFSSDSRYLYVSGDFASDPKVMQFDLEAGDIDAISNSMTVIASQFFASYTGVPQLAPNGKIYVPIDAVTPPSFVDVIHAPNNPGIACQYQKKGLDLGPTGTVRAGLCNVISSYLNAPYIAFPNNAPDTICQLNSPIFYQIPNVQCKVDSITWQTENLSAQIQPNYQYATIRYLTPGTGRLIVTAHTACGSSSDTLEILVVEPLNKTLELGPDLVVCDNGVYNFNAGSGFARYQWSDGTADSTVTTLFPGKYWVNVWDLCGNHQSDTITVSIAPNSVLDLGPDLPQQCSGTSSTYQRPANFQSWQWSPEDFLSCTDCPDVTVLPTISAMWVVIGQTPEGCISVDTLRATIRDTLLFSLDTTVCVGQTLSLLGAHLPADTTAEFFLPALGLGCDTILTVNVLGIDNAASEISTIICSNAFFEYNGTMLPPDTVAVFQLASALACDSVITVTVNSYPTLSLVLPMDTTISIGASVLLEAELTGTGTLDFAWSPPDGLELH
jgi:PKD repeat protein